MHFPHQNFTDALSQNELEIFSRFKTPLENSFCSICDLEAQFCKDIGSNLTKRQAVALGLLARSYQLGSAAIGCTLSANHAGWNCTYRSLLETFFVLRWVLTNDSRLEAFFEGSAPSTGRIKSQIQSAYPELSKKYEAVSHVVHVGDRALHLPSSEPEQNDRTIPFSGVQMNMSTATAINQFDDTTELLALTCSALEELLSGRFDSLSGGTILWEAGASAANFGCLGFEPRLEED